MVVVWYPYGLFIFYLYHLVNNNISQRYRPSHMVKFLAMRVLSLLLTVVNGQSKSSYIAFRCFSGNSLFYCMYRYYCFERQGWYASDTQLFYLALHTAIRSSEFSYLKIGFFKIW